jgi:hypothetical protein
MTFIVRSLLTVSILAAFAFTCSAQVFPAPEGEFHTEYDRFKDQTTSWLLQLQVAEKKYDLDYQRLYLSTWTVFNSTKPTSRPTTVSLMFTSWSLFNNRYTEAAQLDGIVDGVRKSYGAFTPMKRRVINGKYVVTLVAVLSMKDFMQIVMAKKVGMRLGDVEFNLNDHAFMMLRDYYLRIIP